MLIVATLLCCAAPVSGAAVWQPDVEQLREEQVPWTDVSAQGLPPMTCKITMPGRPTNFSLTADGVIPCTCADEEQCTWAEAYAACRLAAKRRRGSGSLEEIDCSPPPHENCAKLPVLSSVAGVVDSRGNVSLCPAGYWCTSHHLALITSCADCPASNGSGVFCPQVSLKTF